MTSGFHTNERYSLERLPCGDLRLRVRTMEGAPGRGEGLARALGGRFARCPRSFIFTPSRAEKWRVLFLGGWAARRRMGRGLVAWVFCRDGLAMNLAGAVNAAKA